MKKLIVLIGIPGSGKSTISSKLLERFGGKVVSSDGIRLELFGTEESQENPILVWDTFYERAFESLCTNEITVLDATFARRRDRTRLFSMFPLDEVKTIGVYLNVPFSRAAIQNSRRTRVVPNFVLESMYSSLQEFPPSKEEGFSDIAEIRYQGDENKLWHLLSST
jgi:predicted kinase